jgi:hypothetical protein
MAGPMERLARAVKRYETHSAVIGLASHDDALSALRPGVRATSLEDLPALLS